MLVAARKLALIALLMVAPHVTFAGGTSERVVQNRHTGIAIGGIDPVGYFTDGAPIKGRPEFEVSAVGASWRFRNAGNLTVFLARPDVYAPRFGGYDPVDVARGVPAPGSAQIWLILGQRLYLFSCESNRDAFAAEPTRSLNEAQARWPTLLTTLAE